MIRARVVLPAVVSALVVVAAAAGAAPPTGDPKGLALLARVQRAYRAVPAIGIALRLGTTNFDLKLVLRSGVGLAEQIVVQTPSGTTTLVARRGGPTWAREPGKSCWQRLPASDSQSIDDLGLPFPSQPRMRVKAPQSTR